MKIVISTTNAFVHGGMSRVVESWARVLGGEGHEVVVLTPADDGAIPVPEIKGVEARVYPVPPATNRLQRLRGLCYAASQALGRIEGEGTVGLLISHDVDLAAAIRRDHPKLPHLLTVHSPFVDENRLNNWKYATDIRRRATYPATWAYALRAERAGLRAVSWVHTLSEYTWSLLRSRHAKLCDALHWQRIPGTFDHQRFVPSDDRAAVRRRLGIDPQALVLLTVRRLIPRNGVDRILAAAARLRSRDDITFLVGGSGELADELRLRVERDGLGSHVRMLGLIPEEDLVATYQAADAFLMPTRDLECFGLPVIEAMAAGCTPLVMPDGGPAEVCRPFPEHVAQANTTAAFVDLVERYVAERIPQRIDGIADHAHGTYSEKAVRPAILDLVGRAGGQA